MAAEYTPITYAEMHAVLTARGFTRISHDGYEYVYEREYIENKHTLRVRIFTSIDIRTNRSRDVGSDAIRIKVINKRNQRAFIGNPRVYRTAGWQYRLNARIDQWLENVVWCDVCSSPMTTRKGTYGEFLGCTNYPTCKFTKAIKAKC